MSKRSVLLKALASMSSDVERLARSVDSMDTAGRRSFSGSLRSMLDFEGRYRAELACVVEKERPTLPAIRMEAVNHGPEPSVEILVEYLVVARQKTLAFLEGLSAGDWQRKATYENKGETSLRFLVQHLMERDTMHLSQLVELCQGRDASSRTPQVAVSGQSVLPGKNNEVKHERRRIRKHPRRRARRRD